MDIITQTQAELSGFVSITRPIHRTREAFIIESIEGSLASCDARWIDVGNNQLEAARRAAELCKLTE
jgi:hypothetical protein